MLKNLFSSSVRADVLSLLLNSPDEKFYVREIAKLITVLARAVQEGATPTLLANKHAFLARPSAIRIPGSEVREGQAQPTGNLPRLCQVQAYLVTAAAFPAPKAWNRTLGFSFRQHLRPVS